MLSSRDTMYGEDIYETLAESRVDAEKADIQHTHTTDWQVPRSVKAKLSICDGDT